MVHVQKLHEFFVECNKFMEGELLCR